LFTVKLCETDCEAYVALPAWDALIVHVPPAIKDAVLAETVQIEVDDEVYVTGKPLLADAVRATVCRTFCEGIVAHMMDCACLPTVKLCITGTAGR
jgi:hypothetical protein